MTAGKTNEMQGVYFHDIRYNISPLSSTVQKAHEITLSGSYIGFCKRIEFLIKVCVEMRFSVAMIGENLITNLEQAIKSYLFE